MDYSITWILFAAWAISCIFYLQKISKIARSNRQSIFSPLSRYNTAFRTIIKRLYLKIFFITLAFALSVFIIYFVNSSS